MTRKRTILIFSVLTLTVLALAPNRAAAQCAGALAAPFTAASELNREGRVERPADLTITSASATSQTCFVAGNSIRVTYNAILSLPTVPPGVTNTSTTNFVLTDPNATLGVTFSTTIVVGVSGPQTVIQIDVVTGTTSFAATTGITLKNLRFDVTGLGDGAILNAFLSSTVPATTPTAFGIGTVRNTFVAAGTVTVGTTTQSSGSSILTTGALAFSTSGSWLLTHPFRTAIASGAVAGDLATNATSLVFDVNNIPSGVTVAFPSTITVSNSIKWTAKSATLSNSGTASSIQVAYDTTSRVGTGSSLTMDTAAAARDFTPATATTAALNPAIQVSVGSTSGFGTASIRVVFGPAESSAFTGDDVNAAGVPRYIASITAGTAANRRIIGSATGANKVPFFIVTATRTVLLYPFATNLFGFQTGISVANTGSDSGFVPATSAQTGSITFFFFPSNAASFSFTPTASVGRGLNASGLLAPGSVFAASLDAMLTAAGQTALIGKFDGYVIAVCQFNFGHGFSIVFNPSGAPTATNALVLGSGTRIGGAPETLHN